MQLVVDLSTGTVVLYGVDLRQRLFAAVEGEHLLVPAARRAHGQWGM
jgi:hypothetical protein